MRAPARGTSDARPLGEFERIARYFEPLAAGAPEALGLRDDAALIGLTQGALVVSADAVVAGVHFLEDDPPDLVARKALRVNLSDVAAMAGEPRFYTITNALPKIIAGASVESWLERFAAGLAQDQAEFGVHLIGGDSVSTPGPVTISVTVFGTVDPASAMRRGGAGIGDDVWVSGTIGDGAVGLMVARSELSTGREAEDASLLDRYRLPRPRTTLGIRLGGLATAGLDVSDGLLQDLGHVSAVSEVGVTVDRAAIPLSPPVRRLLAEGAIGWDDVLAGGDDYELLFTAPAAARDDVLAVAREAGVPVSRIGRVDRAGRGVDVVDESGRRVDSARTGWRHA